MNEVSGIAWKKDGMTEDYSTVWKCVQVWGANLVGG